MSIKCTLGFHLWNACECSRCGTKRNEQHQLINCKCEICGKVLHKWDRSCACCECSRCGTKRNEQHQLINCKCEICGKVSHKWNRSCTCKGCGLVRDKKGHRWKDGICSICGKEKLFETKNNFEEYAKKACHSQQNIRIKYKDANNLLIAITEMITNKQNLEFGKAYDKAKRKIRLECPNCGELTREARSAVYFFSEGGAIETLGAIMSEPNKSCPCCHETILKAIIDKLGC